MRLSLLGARIGSSPSIPIGFLLSKRQKETPKLLLGTEHNSNFARLSCLWAGKHIRKEKVLWLLVSILYVSLYVVATRGHPRFFDSAPH